METFEDIDGLFNALIVFIDIYADISLTGTLYLKLKIAIGSQKQSTDGQ